jgi:hypothetical protein
MTLGSGLKTLVNKGRERVLRGQIAVQFDERQTICKSRRW